MPRPVGLAARFVAAALAPSLLACGQRDAVVTTGAPASTSGAAPGAPADLVVRVLDVGQGDATLVTNGGSVALIDGGPDQQALGARLDALRLGHDTTIDVVVLSHAHADHYMGLRELFSSARR